MERSAPRAIELNEDEQRIFERLGPLFEQERLRMARALASGPLFGQKEFELRDQVHELGARALEVADDERQKKGGYEGASLVCPHCARDARFVERRGKWCHSLLGTIRLTRCYYHCRGCHQGHVPWDQELGIGVATLTPAASEVASIAGVQTSFAQSAEVTLHKLCGLRLSESTVERVTEAAGARLAQLRKSRVTFGPQQNWAWQRDARGRSCAYVSLDAISVRQQGEHGGKAEGRMAYVGMIYNPRSRHDPRRVDPHAVRYLGGFYELDELGLQLRRQAAQVGWDEAEQQIALSDGGNGLESFFRKNFPRAQCILDSGTHPTISRSLAWLSIQTTRPSAKPAWAVGAIS